MLGVELTDMHLISKYKEFDFHFVLLMLLVKYAWGDLLKEKNGLTSTNTFQKALDKSYLT